MGPDSPLSWGQERLWFLDGLGLAGPAYNVPFVLRLQGPLEPAALSVAVDGVVTRHEVLRTRVIARDGVPRAVVDPRWSGGLRVVDAADVDPLVVEEARRPFDLAAGPLLRCLLIRRAPDDHVLVMTVHHLVFDGWSVAVLFEEVAELYRAALGGREPALAPLTTQFGDFAAWERQRVVDDGLRWWRDYLDGAALVLELPGDRARPPVPTSKGGRRRFVVPAPLVAGLREVGQTARATLYMGLMAAVDAWLHRLTGQADLVVGTMTANRTRAEFDRSIGCFANTLAVRADLSGDPTFTELLARVRESLVGVYRHQDVPFERVVTDVAPERDLSRSPVFQVMVVVGAGREPGLDLPDVTCTPLDVELGTARFDLLVAFEDRDDEGLTGSIEYNADLFDPATIAGWADSLLALLDDVVCRPHRRLHQLHVLAEAERSRLSEEAVVMAPASRPLVPDLIARRAQERPEAVAVVAGDQRLSFAALDGRANQLAGALVELGVGPEVPVAVAVPRSAEMLVALVAVLRAGGAYVPLDPTYPAARLAHMLEDAGPLVLVTSPEVVADLPAFAGPVVFVRDADERPAVPPAVAVGPDNLAYVIYTSGSTGQPKGVEIQHASLSNLVEALVDELDLSPCRWVVSVAPYSFDMSVPELFVGPVLGATTLVLDRAESRDPEQLGAALSRPGTFVQLTPTAWEVLLASGWAPTAPDLRAVCGAEAVSSSVWHQLVTVCPAAVNAYGPTEATVWSTLGRAVPGEERPSLGDPLADVRVVVLDEWGEPTPAGAVGELCIGGTGVARGYRGQARSTADVFVPDPFGSGRRLYRTGDLVRRSAAGDLVFVGRRDAQVKVRGFRVELGEVEACLSGHDKVRDVAVVVVPAAAGRELVAHLVVDEPMDLDTLRAHCRARLPDYMVPGVFLAHEALPLSPNGKVDRRALASRGTAGVRLRPRRESVASRDPVEATIGQLVAELLEIDEVGVEDNLFDLGAHSLVVSRLVARVGAKFGVAVPMRAVFEAPTVAGLAALVEDLVAGPARASPIEPAATGGVVPLSFAQQRLWFVDQLDGGGSAYNVPLVVSLRGQLMVEALRTAVEAVVARHEVLRSRVTDETGEPVVIVDPVWSGQVRVVEARGPIQGLVAEEVRRPFDLEEGPVLRCLLIRVGSDDHVLVVTVHHMVFDGWSVGVFADDLGELYAAAVTGRAPRLDPLAVQYRDYARWQRTWLDSGVADEQLAWWCTELAGATTVLALPALESSGDEVPTDGAQHRFEVGPPLMGQLVALARGHDATLFMVLLAAFNVLLHRYTGQQDIVVGCPVANRPRAELDRLVGYFANTLPLRADLADDPTFVELLDQTRQRTIEAYAHQDIPYERVVEAVRPARLPGRNPLVQAVLNVVAVGRLDTTWPDLEVEELSGAEVDPRMDIALYVREFSDGLGCQLITNPTTVSPSDGRRLAADFQLLLGRIVAQPRSRLGNLAAMQER